MKTVSLIIIYVLKTSFCCSNSRCCVFSAVVSLVYASVQKQRFGLCVCQSRLDVGFIYVDESFLCVCRLALYHIDLCALSVRNTFIVIFVKCDFIFLTVPNELYMFWAYTFCIIYFLSRAIRRLLVPIPLQTVSVC